jgi:hypothetical protein
LENRKTKEPQFQMVLLDNDNIDLNVKVHEADHVDICALKEHLNSGGSVFITSKKTQKIISPKTSKAQRNYTNSRGNIGALIQAARKRKICDVHP